MKQKDYFKELKEELKDHPFRDRFLEELEDHAEDIKNDKGLKEKFIESEMIKKYLGEPKEVKENFLNVMHPLADIAFYLEGFCYGMLILPINIFCYLKFTELIEGSSSFLTSLSTTMLLFGGLFILYFLYFKRYQSLKSTVSKSVMWWILLIVLPSTLWMLTLFLSLLTRQ